MRRQRRRADFVAYLYLAPAVAFVGVFLIYPLVEAGVISLYQWDGISVAKWVGLSNYLTAAQTPEIVQSFYHVGVLIIFFAVIPLGLALILAAVVQRGARLHGLGFFQSLIFLPQVIASVVIGVIWVSIYAPTGTMNTVLDAVGLGTQNAWLGDFNTALPAVGLIGTWVEIGLCLVLMVTGISQIPSELYDAVRVDGAGAIREFFAITLPGLRGPIVAALTLTVLFALRTFDIVFVTTGGGPGTSTVVPAFLVYNLAFRESEVGLGSAVGILLVIVTLIITGIIRRLEPKEIDE
ncbi:MAG: sugar ABC transporter permease [Actinobacteria bacterium 69-20]|nr:MAG: sugar ABC transporter permease [Actinobacteria bacterium 69-20]